jgi:hypothetical protein
MLILPFGEPDIRFELRLNGFLHVDLHLLLDLLHLHLALHLDLLGGANLFHGLPN